MKLKCYLQYEQMLIELLQASIVIDDITMIPPFKMAGVYVIHNTVKDTIYISHSNCLADRILPKLNPKYNYRIRLIGTKNKFTQNDLRLLEKLFIIYYAHRYEIMNTKITRLEGNIQHTFLKSAYDL